MSTPSRYGALLRAIEASVREPDAEVSGGAGVSGFLVGRGLTPADEAALSAVPPARFFVYRRLVRDGLASAVRAELPRAARALGDRLDADVERFASAGLSRSHYLRDVAAELVDFAAPSWRADSALPPFVADLARHELASFAIASAPAEPRAADAALALDRPVVFDATARVDRHAYAVHQLDELDARAEARPTALLGYRDAEHEVRFLELSELAAELVERLLSGAPLGDAIHAAAAALGHGVTPALLEGVSELLADLGARGVLLGASPAPGVYKPRAAHPGTTNA